MVPLTSVGLFAMNLCQSDMCRWCTHRPLINTGTCDQLFKQAYLLLAQPGLHRRQNKNWFLVNLDHDPLYGTLEVHSGLSDPLPCGHR